MSLLTLVVIYFLIMDPVGHVKSFVQCLKGIPAARVRTILMRELVFALIVMLCFDILGEYITSFLQISEASVYMASGVILFLGAIQIIFPRQVEFEIPKVHREPFLVPLAIPWIAGPALLATIMLYSNTEPNPYTTVWALSIAWLLAAPILLYSKALLASIGHAGLTACEKLMGMVLVLLSVQRFMDGIHIFIHTLK